MVNISFKLASRPVLSSSEYWIPSTSAEIRASVGERSLRSERTWRPSSTRPTMINQRGDSGIVKMVTIKMMENKIGMANGILQEAETFGPVISEAPRLIHDSRVYPKLGKISNKFHRKSKAED